MQKGKLCDRILKAYQLQNKPNLNNVFKSSFHICDLESLHNSLDYFERL
jgi:regulator of replication initiation timing